MFCSVIKLGSLECEWRNKALSAVVVSFRALGIEGIAGWLHPGAEPGPGGRNVLPLLPTAPAATLAQALGNPLVLTQLHCS